MRTAIWLTWCSGPQRPDKRPSPGWCRACPVLTAYALFQPVEKFVDLFTHIYSQKKRCFMLVRTGNNVLRWPCLLPLQWPSLECQTTSLWALLSCGWLTVHLASLPSACWPLRNPCFYGNACVNNDGFEKEQTSLRLLCQETWSVEMHEKCLQCQLAYRQIRGITDHQRVLRWNGSGSTQGGPHQPQQKGSMSSAEATAGFPSRFSLVDTVLVCFLLLW